MRRSSFEGRFRDGVHTIDPSDLMRRMVHPPSRRPRCAPTADGIDPDAWDDMEGGEREELEAEVVDAATAAATVAELEAEIATLAQLGALARTLRGTVLTPSGCS